MQNIQNILTGKLEEAFALAGYDEKYGFVRMSDRPDLCEFQCNGALSAAKQYHKAPFMIADDVISRLITIEGVKDILTAEVVRPGFININVKGELLAGYLEEMMKDAHLSVPQVSSPKKIVID